MHSFAQTNIQLFNQLRAEGYSSNDINRIRDAYQLTMQLFTGAFRASGKTFIAHLVSTASILVSLHVPAKIVATGLLHATYTHGDFGNGKKGISNAKREQVKRVVGKEIEEYLARYATLSWNKKTIPAIFHRIDTLDPLDRDILLVRLANELEEYLDFGIVYCGDFKHQQYINYDGHLIVEMAEKLGFPNLATQLTEAFKETASAEIPRELCNTNAQDVSFRLAPKSYQKRLSLTFYNLLIHKPRRLVSAIARKFGNLRPSTSMTKDVPTISQSE
ncbi:hypothetical protein H6F78_12135 [Coleofasciculus sp. FACHB-64]|uniref:DUF6817 domain-containing protein n=1 Tax=Cyanophyceae TaxID=3028117 RepID=UPI001689A7AD|nr:MULTISPECIES: hypothetical protein [unclassified Coleofasciculus]MBD1841394.1 hypothetical protein [Coleofasciculus sp. FACHB-501]MBD1944657.1 hypothetical protein [Coleofasciculus sp. FACHB-712]MBD2046332.1 hypothetical protein [Coleofasciculus sp. FACHB-64]